MILPKSLIRSILSGNYKKVFLISGTVQGKITLFQHDGKALRVRPSLLIVGPSNEGRANDILKASSRLVASTVANGENTEIISGSIQNTWAGTARILIEPDLGSEWFLADTTGPLKPVVVQKRKEVKLTRMDHETDDNVFMAKEYIYGTDARGEAFLSFPHLIYGAFPA